MTIHKYRSYSIKRSILFLILLQNVFASPFLVKNSQTIVLEKGKKFSINSEKKKYNFESINFELELINNSIDLKHVKSITFYHGNQALEFAKGGILSGIITGFSSSKDKPKEVIKIMVENSIPLGIIGFFIGHFIPKATNYKISDFEWRFVP